MNNFRNDYNDICHEDILKVFTAELHSENNSYGNDIHSEEAANIMKKKMECEDLDIHFVHGGTMANILALSHGLRHYEGIVAAKTGHIVNHEAGAIEATGHQVILIDTEDGKLNRELLNKELSSFGVDHKIIPRIIYISNTTELGTVYTKEEIEDIYNYCREKGYYLYIDGARMGVALANKHSNLKLTDLPNICDIFTLGGTKNGALFGEAIVIRNDELKDNFRFTLKQRGAMMAKGYLIGLQYKVLFEDNIYLENAEKAMNMADKLVEGLRGKNVEFYTEPISNQIFIVVSREVKERLEKDIIFEVSEVLDDDRFVLRFVTNYRTSEEDVENLINLI